MPNIGCELTSGQPRISRKRRSDHCRISSGILGNLGRGRLAVLVRRFITVEDGIAHKDAALCLTCGLRTSRFRAVCAGVLFEALLSNSVKCKRRNGFDYGAALGKGAWDAPREWSPWRHHCPENYASCTRARAIPKREASEADFA